MLIIFVCFKFLININMLYQKSFCFKYILKRNNNKNYYIFVLINIYYNIMQMIKYLINIIKCLLKNNFKN